MLDGLFVTPAVTAISEALTSARAEGTLVVVGDAKLATALAAGRTVITVGVSGRAAKKLGATLDDTTSIEARSVDAVVGVAPEGAGLDAWVRIVRDGGAIVLVDKGHAAEASQRALCVGLTEIEQRHAGRTVITSGLVTH